MNNEGCKMSDCVKPMLISTIVVAITLFALEYVIHGVWLMPLYQQTASMWRPMDQMGMFPWCIIRLIVLAFLFSALYCKCKKAKGENCEVSADGKKPCPVKSSLCFGIVLGLLLGTMDASAYLWMPIPGELAVKWFIGGLVEGIVVSIVMSCLCSKMSGNCKP